MRKHVRKELDDLMERLDACHSPITVMGKVYPSNPYILNKINSFLAERRLSLYLISFDETKIKVCTEQEPPYLFHSDLDAIADDIAVECERIMNAKKADNEDEEAASLEGVAIAFRGGESSHPWEDDLPEDDCFWSDADIDSFRGKT